MCLLIGLALLLTTTGLAVAQDGEAARDHCPLTAVAGKGAVQPALTAEGD